MKAASKMRLTVNSLFVKLLVCVPLVVSVSQTAAFSCGGIFDVECNLREGGLSPENLGDQMGKAGEDISETVKKAGQDVANAVNELQASVLTGPTLALAIQSSRDSAIGTAQPIPPHIRQRLTGYISEDALNRVRFKIGDNGFVNLAQLLERGGLARAVTLIDVVVFKDAGDAEDVALWAHELAHVEQYASWGVHSFSVQYARNWQSVENPAYEKGNNYWNWASARGQGSNLPVPGQIFIPNQAPPPPPLVYFCHTSLGRYGPFNPAPPGVSCFVNFPNGRVFGVTGP
jgi:hypothetical protein